MKNTGTEQMRKTLVEIVSGELCEAWLLQRPYDRIVHYADSFPRYKMFGHGKRRTKLRVR